jgi:hypothetical protein
MGLGRPIIFRSLENGRDFGLFFRHDAFSNDRLQRCIIAVNTGWKPDCESKAVLGALRCSCLERARAERSE